MIGSRTARLLPLLALATVGHLGMGKEVLGRPLPREPRHSPSPLPAPPPVHAAPAPRVPREKRRSRAERKERNRKKKQRRASR